MRVLGEEPKGAAGRDVARRVLVEQGLVKESVEPDPAAPVDDCDLARPGGAVVARCELARHFGTAVNVDLHRACALEAHAQRGNGAAVDEQRLGRAHDGRPRCAQGRGS